MSKGFFGTILLVTILSICPFGSASANSQSLGLYEPGSHGMVLTPAFGGVAPEEQQAAPPAKTAPPVIAEEQSVPKTAPAAKDTTIDLIKTGATNFTKEVGGDIGKFFTEVKDGYLDIYNQGLAKATQERNEWIAAHGGQQPSVLRDVWTGFKSTFVPSLTFSFTKWGWPAIKTIFGMAAK